MGNTYVDRKTLKKELIKCTTTKDMCPIRHSLFDLVRQREQSLKDTKLAERPIVLYVC
jgi:hypothetical protein